MSAIAIHSRLEFAEIGDPTRLMLRRVWATIRKDLPAVLDVVRTRLATEPQTSHLNRDDRQRISEAHLRHARVVFDASFESAYAKSGHELAALHAKFGLDVNTILAVNLLVLQEIGTAFRNQPKASSDDKRAALTAIQRIVFLEFASAFAALQEAIEAAAHPNEDDDSCAGEAAVPQTPPPPRSARRGGLRLLQVSR